MQDATSGPDLLGRRRLLHWGVQGLAATALSRLLGEERGIPGAAPRARRAIHICLIGGLSQVDSFDHKPLLEKRHGKPMDTKERPEVFFNRVGLLRKSDWEFARRGSSGLRVSDLFPHLAGIADKLTVIRSMVSDTGNHTPALFLANSGFQPNGFPSMGSWLSYGLGNETDSLPSYVVLSDPRGGPNGGSTNWSNAFLPARHQGVPFENGPNPVRDLFPSKAISTQTESASRRLLETIDRRHLDRRGGDAILEARLQSFELAARMQLSVPEVSDLSAEPRHIAEMYGAHEKRTADGARRCILARRLVESGVRFVQIFSGGPLGGKPRTSWDGHEDMRLNHSREAGFIDKPVAALIVDLERRGLLDDTLVLCTTEFGRTPFTQSAANQLGTGRDHNHAGFTVWKAGAGLKPGFAYGATDEFGYRAVENPVTWNDFHATLLHLFGIDHEKLTFYHNGLHRRLTNVQGEVVDGLLA